MTLRLAVLLATCTVLLAACDQEPATPATPAQPAVPAEPAAPAAPAEPAEAALPASFQGRWAADAAACAAEGHESRLVIDAKALRFHESVGEIRNIVLDGPSDATITADYQGEGESWSRTQRLTLSADGQTLTLNDPDGGAFARVRCPASKG